MHELGLATAVIRAVCERARGRPVARVRLHIGRLQLVQPESFDQSFMVAALGTEAEGAVAEVVYEDVKVRCGNCGLEAEGDGMPLVCAACGSSELCLLGGSELVLESVEYRAG